MDHIKVSSTDVERGKIVMRSHEVDKEMKSIQEMAPMMKQQEKMLLIRDVKQDTRENLSK